MANKIIASYWTFAGNCEPALGGGSDASPLDFRARMEAAASVGCRGVGLNHDDVASVSACIGLPEMHRILVDNGLEDVEVEFLKDWFVPAGSRREASDRVRRILLEASEELGARHIKIAGDMSGDTWPVDLYAEAFSALCEEASRANSRVCIEFMPFSDIPSLGIALEIVRRAGAPNGGVLIDSWHFFRGGMDVEEISLLPPQYLVSVELNDAAPAIQGDIFNDTVHHRLPCGHGCFDLQGLMSEIDKIGYRGPVGVEILSSSFRQLPLARAAEIAIGSVQPYLRGE